MGQDKIHTFRVNSLIEFTLLWFSQSQTTCENGEINTKCKQGKIGRIPRKITQPLRDHTYEFRNTIDKLVYFDQFHISKPKLLSRDLRGCLK